MDEEDLLLLVEAGDRGQPHVGVRHALHGHVIGGHVVHGHAPLQAPHPPGAQTEGDHGDGRRHGDPEADLAAVDRTPSWSPTTTGWSRSYSSPAPSTCPGAHTPTPTRSPRTE